MKKTSRFCIRLFLFLILGILLLSCTQEPTRKDDLKNPKEGTALISTPVLTDTPTPTSTTSQTPTSCSTSTMSLIDTSKVPERARLLVQALTKKDDTEQEWYGFPDGVLYHDIYIGDGKSITNGVAVHMLLKGILEDGTEFVNTMNNKVNKSYFFTFGHGDTLKSFEQGVASMREKGKRVIVVPPELAYGDKEYKSPEIFIPPNSTLIFEASLMWIREPEWDKIDLFK